MLRLDKVKKYIDNDYLNRIGNQTIKSLEEQLLESYDIEICETLAKYYLKTNNIERAIYISKLMYEKDNYYYDDNIIESIIVDYPNSDLVNYLKTLNEPYIYEALANYYYVEETDYEQALKYFKKINNIKNRSCYYNQGNMYLEGNGVKEDISTALFYFKKGYNFGCVECTSQIGQMYFEGNGLEKDPKLGYKYLQEAIKPNNTTFKDYIEHIITIPENKVYAKLLIELLEESVECGNMDDIHTIGYIYESILYDNEKAYNYYKFIIDNKELFSESVYKTTAYLLGFMYLEGRYVNLDIFKAKQCYELAEDEESLNELKYYLGEIKEIDFTKCVEEATETFDLESDDYFRRIYNLANTNPQVYIFRSLKEITKEVLADIPQNSLIYLKNNVYDESIMDSLYTWTDMKKIINSCNDLIKDINIDEPEEDKFMKIYTRILNKVKSSVEYDLSEDIVTLSDFTLYSIIAGKAVCSGYSKLLKELLNLVGIESNVLKSTRHQYNQVKINNKWYYCDIYWDSVLKNLDYCLKSSEDFCKEGCHMPLPVEEINESNESYPDIESLYNKNNIKAEKPKQKKKKRK